MLTRTTLLRAATVALAAAAAALLAGCTSSGGSSSVTGASQTAAAPSTTSKQPATQSGQSSPPASPSTVAPTQTAKGGPLTVSQAKSALLSAGDVGSGLTPGPVDNSHSRFPCTPKDPPVDVQVPPKASANATFNNTTQDIAVSEQIESYADAATAAKALAIGEKGLTCDIGTVGKAQVTIQGPIDLSTSFTTKLDKAELWAVDGGAAKQSIIVAKMGQRIVAITFAEVSGADDSSLDAKGIADRAIAKVGAAG